MHRREEVTSIMSLLQDQDREQIRSRLASMVEPVTLVNFTQELECQTCRETHQLLAELVELSDKLRFEAYNFLTDKEKTEAYRIDKIPGTVITAGADRGIRLYGIPSGYEFAALLDDILMVSRGDSGLSSASRDKLAAVHDPLHIQVFVTPT
jgi:glutaredoxin-like protein